MTKKTLSTFEREMKDPVFKKSFKKSYQQFLLSEFMMAVIARCRKFKNLFEKKQLKKHKEIA